MEYVIMGIVFGLCLFILPLWAYRRGLQDGLAITKGKPIEPIQTPVQAVQSQINRSHESKEAKTANEEMVQGLMNIMAYDGTKQKEGEK